MVFWSSCGSDQAVCLEELLVADVIGFDHVGLVLFVHYDTHG